MNKDFLEAIGILQEEAAEVIQGCSKIRRSGPFYQPFGGELSNFELVQNEVYDFIVLAELAGFRTVVPLSFKQAKLERLKAWSTLNI